MEKMRLELDELAVETFEAAGAGSERGTVEAHAPETAPGVCPRTGDWYCTFGGRYCTAPADCWIDPDTFADPVCLGSLGAA